MERTTTILQKDSRTLTEPAEIESELAGRIAAFNAAKLPLFRRLGVI